MATAFEPLCTYVYDIIVSNIMKQLKAHTTVNSLLVIFYSHHSYHPKSSSHHIYMINNCKTTVYYRVLKRLILYSMEYQIIGQHIRKLFPTENHIYPFNTI